MPQGILNGKPYVNLFTTVDNDFHAKIKRPVARAYAMTALLEYEPFVDTTTIFFLKRMDELYAFPGRRPRSVCDFGKWLQYYAFDVIGEMTFSKRFGFLEHDEDVGGILQSLANTQWLFQIAQMPWIDKWFRKNRFQLKATGFTSPVVKFTTDQLKAKLGVPISDLDMEKRPVGGENRKDFLSRFLDAQTTYPDIVDTTRVVSYAQANITAGSDTTAITLRAILYHLMKNPQTMARLQEEIDLATIEGRASIPCVTWSESQKLPYLDAVVKEGLRIHPAVGLPLERIVPAQGLTIYGTNFPPGTIIGVNPWVIHRDKRIFGDDAECFRPERWIEASPEARKRMESANMAFGAGARTCIGKNISLLEVYKLIPTLIRRYRFEFVRGGQEWKTHNAFFVHQTGLDLRLWRRHEGNIDGKYE